MPKVAEEWTRDRGCLLNGKDIFKGRPNALDDKSFEAYVKSVYFLLTDVGFIRDGLTLLEEAIATELGGSGPADVAQQYFTKMETFNKLAPDEQGEHPRDAFEGYDLRFSGLLSRVLIASQWKGGFEVGQRVTIGKAVNPSDLGNIRAFAGLQKVKQHFKDINAGAEHGEYTHQIQWFIVTELWGAVTRVAAMYYEEDQQTSDGFTALDSPAAMMAAVGETGMAAVGLWPMLFDRVTNTVNGVYTVTEDPDVVIEGRCPEVLHLYMRHMKHAAEFPTLRNFLRSRYAKRKREEGDPDFNYYDKKKSQLDYTDYDDAHYELKNKGVELPDPKFRMGYLQKRNY